MGDEADDILTSLSLNEEDSAKFNGVKAKFDAYFIGIRNVIYERAKFNQRKQMTGEPVDSFITSLHKLIEHCDAQTGCGPGTPERGREKTTSGSAMQSTRGHY